MVRTFLMKADDWQTRLGRHHGADLMVAGLAFFTTLLGLVMTLNPTPFKTAPSFAKTFEKAEPETWGVLFIISSALLVISFLARSDASRYCALILCGLYALFGFLTAAGPLTTGQGVLSGGVVYSAMAWFSFVTMIFVGARIRVNRK